MIKAIVIPRRLSLLLGIGLICAILVGSLMPNPPIPNAPNSDKYAHLLGYAILSAWWSLNLPKRPWLVFLTGSAIGILIECLQGLTPYRSFDPLDMLANSTGCIVGLFIAWLFRPYLKVSDRP